MDGVDNRIHKSYHLFRTTQRMALRSGDSHSKDFCLLLQHQ